MTTVAEHLAYERTIRVYGSHPSANVERHTHWTQLNADGTDVFPPPTHENGEDVLWINLGVFTPETHLQSFDRRSKAAAHRAAHSAWDAHA